MAHVSRILRLTATLYFIIQHSSQASKHPFRPGGQRHLLVSIHQSCSANATINRTLLNREAEIAYRTSQSIFHPSNQDIINDLLLRRFWAYKHIKDRGFTIDDIEFIPYDICDEQDLASVFSEILLSRKFHLKAENDQQYPSWRDGVIDNNHWQRLSRILAVIIYADNWLVQRFKTFLWEAEHFLVVTMMNLNQTSLDEEVNQNTRFRLAGDRVEHETKDLIELLETHGIEHLHVIHFEQKDSTMQQIYFNSFIQLFNITQRCFHLETIHENTLNTKNRVIRLLNETKSQKVVLLFGEPEKQAQLVNYASTSGLDGVTWILRDVDSKQIKIRPPDNSYVYTFLYVDYLLPTTEAVEKATTVLNPSITLSNPSTDMFTDLQTRHIMLKSYQTTTRLLANYHRVTILWPAGRPKGWLTFKQLYEEEMTSQQSYGRLFRVQWEDKYKVMKKRAF
eukprot:TCONS_00057431-protein